MDQLVRAVAVPAEDPAQFLAPTTGSSQSPETPSARHSMPSFGFLGALLHMHKHINNQINLLKWHLNVKRILVQSVTLAIQILRFLTLYYTHCII